jgi:hypothetical protein
VTTLKAARAALAAQIVTAVADTTVTVLDYDPPMITGTAVTVSTAGVTPMDWRLFVRVYVDAIQSAEGQDRLDDLVEAIDVAAAMQPTPRPEWEWTYDDVKGIFLMQAVVEYSREDF